MPSPVNPNQFCEAVPAANSDLCVKVTKFFGIADLLCQFFGWFLTGNAISEEAKAEIAASIVPTGTFAFSATLNMGSGYLLCDGREISRTTYAALFAQIGTRYGAGDGSTTFNLPDPQSRSPIAAGQGSGLTFRDINAPDVGEETHVQTEAELPAHSHDIKVRHFTLPLSSEPGVRDLPSPTGVDFFPTEDTGGGVGFNVVHPCFVCFVFIKV